MRKVGRGWMIPWPDAARLDVSPSSAPARPAWKDKLRPTCWAAPRPALLDALVCDLHSFAILLTGLEGQSLLRYGLRRPSERPRFTVRVPERVFHFPLDRAVA